MSCRSEPWTLPVTLAMSGSRQGVAAPLAGGDPADQGDPLFGRSGGAAVFHRTFSTCRVKLCRGTGAGTGSRPGCRASDQVEVVGGPRPCPGRSELAISVIGQRSELRSTGTADAEAAIPPVQPPLSASLTALPAVNLAALDAAIVIASPV
jgi:hypothetical protein